MANLLDEITGPVNDNGRDVPVYWDEYLPVTGSGCMFIKEDNDKEDFKSHSQRIEHVSDVLGASNFELYRRHIASKI